MSLTPVSRVRTRDVFLSSRTCLGLVGIWTRTCLGLAKCSSWSRPSPAIYAFFLFQNKTIKLALVPQMGNVIAIGLTPSRTDIVIGRLLNAQLRHMSVGLALSVRAAWRHK